MMSPSHNNFFARYETQVPRADLCYSPIESQGSDDVQLPLLYHRGIVPWSPGWLTWGEVIVMPWGCISSPGEGPHWGLQPSASINCQPHEWTPLEAGPLYLLGFVVPSRPLSSESEEEGPPASVKPSDDDSPGWTSNYNPMRDPRPGPPSQATPEFLTHTHYER